MKSIFSNGRIRLIPLLILLLAFGGLILAVFWLMVSPVGASFLVQPAPAPTQEYTWSYVEIAKPAYATIVPFIGTTISESTSIIEATQTPIPTDTPTETPAALAMEVLENTPTPIYVAPTQAPYVDEAPPSYSYSGSKYILVDISEQHMYVYEGDVLLYSFVASTGLNNATSTGNFAVQSKIPSAYGATWDIWMPNWLGIYWAGGLENGIHALPILSNGATLWEGYLGRPVSYGCIVLGTYESKLLYDWAEIGTPVEIQW